MKLPLLFFIIFFTTGCGIKKLAIKHADYFIYHQASKWLPINFKQKKEIYQDIKNFLNNSKNTAKNINSVIDEIDLKDEKNIEKNYIILESSYSQILKDFIKIISSQLSKIDPKQQKVFFEKLEKLNVLVSKVDTYNSYSYELKNILTIKITMDNLNYFLINNQNTRISNLKYDYDFNGLENNEIIV